MEVEKKLFGWVRNEHEIGKGFVHHKEATKLLRVFVRLLEVFQFVFVNNLSLYKLIHIGGIVVPLSFKFSFSYQGLTYR